ncbi:phosphopentomutase [Thermosediminibacter oceani]|uniref:Phosphopentomutase n=1 Tax=Thermosediminibacter oceani (strain ATCC BAA-1034 / DSM 16646 / JW/IW-1228P) TaxID=555079 RepID=D9S1U0_THEOJ|nr:phosphopentomutase [Thermosediminibacter oceani]ADL07367.1 phosphopentomutase [Thermosediminibacter oceani DSM 16646]
MVERTIIVVLDSVGIGELPDAALYGDEGSNTLANTAKAVGGLNLPNLRKLGLGNIIKIQGVPPVPEPEAAYGMAAERSAGKDTTTGHWEIAGIILEKPFPVYPEGFPPEVIEEFERKIGTKTLGNRPASGTRIIEELGEEHMRTGYPIVYTSADSVFQIAAHEEVIPLERLYEMCMIAREILQGDHAVSRVIARPFVGTPGNFVRTYNRKDFSLKPPQETLLDKVKKAGMDVYAVGKIWDIFAGQGITREYHTEGNMDGVDKVLLAMQQMERGLIMANLVDYDMLYGHRNDPAGYARALEDFDGRVPEIMAELKSDDVLIITADHGCDPTTPSTDHSREYVPVLVTGKKVRKGTNLGVLSTFSDIGQTVADLLGCEELPNGKSFKSKIMEV